MPDIKNANIFRNCHMLAYDDLFRTSKMETLFNTRAVSNLNSRRKEHSGPLANGLNPCPMTNLNTISYVYALWIK